MSEANKNSVSVIIDEEKSTKAPNHKKVARLPKKTVQKAPLIAEQEKKTKKAEAHVAGLKILNDYKRRVEVEEAALVELKKSTKITIDNSLKRNWRKKLVLLLKITKGVLRMPKNPRRSSKTSTSKLRWLQHLPWMTLSVRLGLSLMQVMMS